VWFFSFLIWFSELRNTYGDNMIILLDEPGLSLHARAQQDLLRYIEEKLRPQYQVVYTSHSPFMVDTEDLLRVRTVEDVDKDDVVLGTKVGDKVFSSDADTVFPLQAALGYDITQSLFVGEHTLIVEGPSDLLYLRWFSSELARLGRTSLDPRWVIAPCGGIDKVSSFVALFGGNKLHVAVFADYAAGQKQKLRSLEESSLLRDGHVFTAAMYVSQGEADIEDLLGRSTYVGLVNHAYELKGKDAVSGTKSADAPERVALEVKNHFRTLPPSVPEFEHLVPATHLFENSAEMRDNLPDFEDSLERFEKLFTDLNALLVKQE
jgi:hypothetical protein